MSTARRNDYEIEVVPYGDGKATEYIAYFDDNPEEIHRLPALLDWCEESDRGIIFDIDK